MGKILDLVKKHFSQGEWYDSFSAREFGKVTGIDDKVAAMNLKKLANSERLGSFQSGNGTYTTTMYFYRTVDQINESVKKQNEFIDKHSLKNRKLKPMEQQHGSINKSKDFVVCKDKFGQTVNEGDFVDVQKDGPQQVYKKEDGQLYFKPYGKEDRVSAYFSNDMVKCKPNGEWLVNHLR